MAKMQIDEESSLDIFEMSVRTSEPTKEVVNKELLMFKRFQVDVKDIKCPLERWAKIQVFISNYGSFCSSNS
jgi:hypothetical protein